MHRDLNHADMKVSGVRVFNSFFRRFDPADVYIKDGKFLYIDRQKTSSIAFDQEIKGNDRYMIPGLIDIHMHIESSMVTPLAFCRYTAGCGLTTIVSEPHEIASVCGKQAIKAMIESGKQGPYDCYYAIPSNVPIMPEQYETAGASITAEDMLELKETENVICLGEVMNYTEIIRPNDSEVGKFIDIVHEKEPFYTLEGHCPALVNEDLAKFLFLGIRSDHCTHTLEELKQRFENGMFIQLQDVMVTQEVIDYVCREHLYEYFSFVTDDTLPDVLVKKGHLDAVVRKAISLGMRPEDAVYCASWTPSKRMGLVDRGAIAPGLLADFVLVEDPASLNIQTTYKKGVCIYDRSAKTDTGIVYDLNGLFEDTIHHEAITTDGLKITVPGEDRMVNVRVMKLNPNNNRSDEAFVRMPVKNNELLWKDSGCNLAVVIERHGRDGKVSFGFTCGTGVKEGACASSYAHDSHNLIAMGTNEEDIVCAVNEIIAMNGGIAVSLHNEITGKICLPIAGLLSKASVEETAKDFDNVRRAFDAQGYEHINNIMNFSLIALTCIPTLKLTDRGYMNADTFEQPPLYEEL